MIERGASELLEGFLVEVIFKCDSQPQDDLGTEKTASAKQDGRTKNQAAFALPPEK